MTKFEDFTDSWINLAANFAIKDELTSLINEKYELAIKIFEYLDPIRVRFIESAIGRSTNYDSDLRYAININRLLRSKDLDHLPDNISNKLIELIKETFTFGMLTQLFLMYFPTRDKYAHVDLDSLETNWIIDAVVADTTMGYYGDKNNPICMNVWEIHFQDFVKIILKRNIRINAYRMGKFASFFRNLYLAGALLVMRCDLETKKLDN